MERLDMFWQRQSAEHLAAHSNHTLLISVFGSHILISCLCAAVATERMGRRNMFWQSAEHLAAQSNDNSLFFGSLVLTF